jgi:dynein heavy chain
MLVTRTYTVFFQLVCLLCQVPFDIFSIKHRDAWKMVKDQFYNEVSLIEGEAKSFIDASFKSLRSAEGAFDMLMNFKHIRSREAINSQMMRKFNDILAQFGKEVDVMDALFQESKSSPPLYKNQPPVAGSVNWEKSLFHRMKRTILRFMTLETMMQTEQGKAVRKCWMVT